MCWSESTLTKRTISTMIFSLFHTVYSHPNKSDRLPPFNLVLLLLPSIQRPFRSEPGFFFHRIRLGLILAYYSANNTSSP
ncbi:hypothetical protein GGR55DRAFT_667662 [Xylaria sp. FL0064]|nr:hypothetical protein GGR55DRAFT_667662 [Xylaria sp. FL0064]